MEMNGNEWEKPAYRMFCSGKAEQKLIRNCKT